MGKHHCVAGLAEFQQREIRACPRGGDDCSGDYSALEDRADIVLAKLKDIAGVEPGLELDQADGVGGVIGRCNELRTGAGRCPATVVDEEVLHQGSA